MSIYSALYDHLAGNAGVSALVSTRIYATVAPANTAQPYVTFFRVSEEHFNHLLAAAGHVNVRMQCDVWAATPDSAAAVGDALRSALHGYSGTMGDELLDVRWATIEGRRDESLEPKSAQDQWVHRSSLDFLIAHSETVPTF